MKNRLNINLVLCQDFDEENKTIYKMFNKITTDINHTATFSLVTFLNGFGDEENETEFTLHYYLMEPELEEKGKKRGIYLGAIDFIRNSKDQSNESEDAERNNTFAEMRLNNVPFLHSVEYRIEAYKVKEKLDPKLDYFELRGKSSEYRKSGELVSVANFDVEFPKK